MTGKTTRFNELTGRITNNAVKRAAAKLAIDKEWVLRGLVENLERGKTVEGRSSVVNRAGVRAQLLFLLPDGLPRLFVLPLTAVTQAGGRPRRFSDRAARRSSTIIA
jgi:hypothetical protein